MRGAIRSTMGACHQRSRTLEPARLPLLRNAAPLLILTGERGVEGSGQRLVNAREQMAVAVERDLDGAVAEPRSDSSTPRPATRLTADDIPDVLMPGICPGVGSRRPV